MKETAYLFQAALICTWWACLAASEPFFEAFQFSQISSTAFWAFFAPDIVLIAGLSVVRSYHKNAVIEYVILGAFGYASLYCCNACVLTASGYLATSLMLAGLAYNGFLCFQEATFRTSSSSTLANAAKTVVQIVCIWILALAVVPFVILDAFNHPIELHFGAWFYAGILMFTGCSLLGLTSSFFMVRDGNGTPLPLDQTNDLVVSGPYRFVRNPMAIAGVGQGFAIGLMFQSVPLLTYAILGALVWHFVVRPFEERDMNHRFGDAYLRYQQRVSCWIPTLPRDVQ